MSKMTGLVRPLSRVRLHSHDTPLQPFNISSETLGGTECASNSLNFFIKRDDLTGFEFSGNKIRKLEYLLGEAKRLGCDTIVSYGKKQSNWCRATVTASKYLGFDVHLILNCENDCEFGDASNFCANYLLDVIYGAKVHIVSNELYKKFDDNYKDNKLLLQLTNHLTNNCGKKCFPLVCGGSDKIGVWGYIDMIENELVPQIKNLQIENKYLNKNETITDIVVPTASGGTAFGIAIGCYLNQFFNKNENNHYNSSQNGQNSGQRPKIHAMLTMGEKIDYYYDCANNILKDINFEVPENCDSLEELLNIEFHEATGIGYSKNIPNEFNFFITVAQESGVLLDPTYNGKSLYYFVNGVNNGSIKTQGNNVVFLHTGGLFAYFDDNKIKYMKTCVPLYRQRQFDFVSKL